MKDRLFALGLMLLCNVGFAQNTDYQKAGEAVGGGDEQGKVRFFLPPKNPVPKWTFSEKERGYVVFADNYLRTFWSNQKPTRKMIVERVSTQLARDEYEPVQIGICATDSKAILENVKIEVSIDLPFVIRRLEYKEVTPTMPKLKHLGKVKIPFWLPEGDTFEKLAENQTGTFWITFYASKDAKAGVHDGRIIVKVKDKPAMTIKLSVNVLPFILPKPDIAFGLYYYPEASASIRRQYPAVLKDMAEHGTNSSTLYAFYAAVYDKQTDKVTMKIGDNSPKTKGFPEKYIRNRLKFGMANPDIPMLLVDYTAIRSPGGWVGDVLSDQQKVKIANFYRRYWRKNHFPEFLAYLRDEPPITPEAGYIRWAKGWKKTCMRTAAALSFPATVAWGYLHDIWITHTGCITPEMIKEAQRQGAQQWTYTFSLGKYNTLSNRYHSGLYTWALGLRGNYHWAYLHRTDDNFVDIKDKIIPRVSWPGRREGVDDYRYLQLLEALIAKARPNNPIAKQAREWLAKLRTKADWKFFHGISIGNRDSGAFCYPAPNIEPNEYTNIRNKAAEFAIKLGTERFKTPPTRPKPDRSRAAKWEAAPFDGKTIAECIAGLEADDFYVRRAAAAQLAERGKQAKSAVAKLVKLLDDPDVRIVAMRALGAIGKNSANAVKQMSIFLSHRDVYIRMSAVWSLGSIGQPALDALRLALKNNSPEVVMMAGEAIAKLGPKAAPAVPELISILKSNNIPAQRGALKALEKIGPASAPAVPVLAKLLDKCRARNVYMLRTLAAIGPAAKDAVPVLKKYRMERRRYTDVVLEFALFKITHDKQCLKNIVDILFNPPAWSPYVMSYLAPIIDELGAEASAIAPDIEKFLKTDRGKRLGTRDKKHFDNFLRKVYNSRK